MRRTCSHRVLLVLAVACLAQAPASAQSDQVLRDELRQTTLQLRSVQDENAALKAKLQSLTQRLELLDKRPPAAAAAADPEPARKLQRALDAQAQRAEALQAQLDEARRNREQWQAAYQKVVAVAQERDAAAKQCESSLRDVDARAQSCETKNAALVEIGNELVQRYENKGVWDAMAGAEPLTQLGRVRLQELTQEYRVKIKDAMAEPNSVPAKEAQP